MSDDLPEKIRIWPRLIIYPIVLALVVLLLNPFPRNRVTEQARKAEAKHSTTGLLAALKGYHTEYGNWPDYTGDGLFLDEKRHARLLLMLRGKDDASNPRKIVFFETKSASKTSDSGHPFRSGLSPETGAFLDPWGNPYRIAIDADDDGQIANPYPDDPYNSLAVPALVWSLGKDGRQGAPANPSTSKGSDDVLSWQ